MKLLPIMRKVGGGGGRPSKAKGLEVFAHVKVSDVDYKYLRQFGWRLMNKGYPARYVTNETIMLHRVVAERAGWLISHEIDHRNGDKLDARRRNLRPATKANNGQNRFRTSNYAGFKGISRTSSRKKFVARINSNGEQFYLGSFSDPVDAAKAYDKAALKLFGKFARTNQMLGLLP